MALPAKTMPACPRNNNAQNFKYGIVKAERLKRYKILFCKILAMPLDTQKSIADTKCRDTLLMLPNPENSNFERVLGSATE